MLHINNILPEIGSGPEMRSQSTTSGMSSAHLGLECAAVDDAAVPRQCFDDDGCSPAASTQNQSPASCGQRAELATAAPAWSQGEEEAFALAYYLNLDPPSTAAFIGTKSVG
jgi:hypothetical protein